MPILRIDSSQSGSNDNARLILLEMQGVLETDSPQFINVPVGQLQTTDGSAVLTIGKQRLKGSIVKLKKPMIILDTKADASDGTAGRIVQVIEEKISFTSRPLTIFDKS